jgi:hypothetical protein
MSSILRSFLPSILLAIAALGVAAVATAQSLPAGVQLGMSPAELQAALPEAQRVARPQRLAGGLAGTWRGASTAIAGLTFEPTFYFAGTELRRVEWLADAGALPDHGASAFDALLGWGRGRFGNELASRDPGRSSSMAGAGPACAWSTRRASSRTRASSETTADQSSFNIPRSSMKATTSARPVLVFRLVMTYGRCLRMRCVSASITPRSAPT